jgi:hypothetical protein
MTSATCIPTFFKVDLFRSNDVTFDMKEPLRENWQLNKRVYGRPWTRLARA